MPKYCIAGLFLEITAPEWVIHQNLEIFLCNSEDIDIHCSLVFENRAVIPEEKAKPIVKTTGTRIYEFDGNIHSLSGDKKDIPSCMVMSEDFSYFTMYIDPEYDDKDDKETSDCVREGVFAALRKVMITKLAYKDGVIIHSCTIKWNNKGIIFSAPSGTGKSTHAHLWKQLYGTQILDGDATACRIINGLPTVYGLPWCGTSGEFLNQNVPLGAIVFLQQAEENSIKKLDFMEAFLRLAARCFLLPWNEKLTDQFMDNIQKIAESTDCYVLDCRPDYSAVELVKKCLEKK